jgi:hypothetical protein
MHAALTRVLLSAGLVMLAAAAQAQQAPEHGHGEVQHPPHAVVAPPPAHYDSRYDHGHYYPPHGAYVHTLPPAPLIVDRPGGRYYYSGGVWYAPHGPSYVVVRAPVGVFVPVLPAFYTTVWFGGVPYYYANESYYTWSADQNSYEVVDPPADVQQQATAQAPPSDDMFAYPQNGQPEEQQATDKYECHRWAVSQSGFDPTQSGGGVAPDQSGARHADYDRAMQACLQGRGYSVR